MFQMSIQSGRLDAEELEAVPVGEHLLAEVVVASGRRSAAAAARGRRRRRRPAASRRPGPAHAEDVLPGVDLPDQVLGRVGSSGLPTGACPSSGRSSGSAYLRQVDRAVVESGSRAWGTGCRSSSSGRPGSRGSRPGLRVPSGRWTSSWNCSIRGDLILHRGDEARGEHVDLGIERRRSGR